MKLAISNIAWPIECDRDLARLLEKLGVTGIEIAPTKIWPRPLEASAGRLGEYGKFWGDFGIRIVAAQSLLFGRPELALFDSEASRSQMLEYLQGIVRLAGQLEIESLVFGSPQNRRVGSRQPAEAWSIAVRFFRQLAQSAREQGVCVAIEPNPANYGSDFILCAEEALRLIEAVDDPAFRLNLDTACMTLAADPIEPAVSACIKTLQHVHVSEPGLAAIGNGGVDHVRFARALQTHAYSRWISIEMRQTADFSLAHIQRIVGWVKLTYGV